MIASCITHWFNGRPLVDGPEYSLWYKTRDRKKNWFPGKPTLRLTMLVLLHTDTICFTEMVSVLRKGLTENSETRTRFDCIWVVLSAKGGIYLFETLASKENTRIPGMKNRFLVINSGDGTISFGPGHVMNRAYSERMHQLLSRITLLPPAVFTRELAGIMDDSLSQML